MDVIGQTAGLIMFIAGVALAQALWTWRCSLSSKRKRRQARRRRQQRRKGW